MNRSGAYVSSLPLLEPGQRVAVITPSGPPEPAALGRGCDLLRSWGVEPVLGANVNTGRAMTAGCDADRIADLAWALTDPDVAAVFCGRGGYGLLRVLDDLPWRRIGRTTPKPVVGFSDVTCLHAALATRVGWPSVLGAHVAGGLADTGATPTTATSLHDLLFSGRMDRLFSDEVRVVRGGRCRAIPLRGGNLAMLAALAGSRDGRPPDAPFIAVLEDVNEAPYRVDRMLTQLLRSRWFDRAVGVICGAWEGCRGDSVDVAGAAGGRGDAATDELEAVLLERLGPIGGPLLLDAPFGHAGVHVAVPLGVPMRLDTSLRTLTFDPVA